MKELLKEYLYKQVAYLENQYKDDAIKQEIKQLKKFIKYLEV